MTTATVESSLDYRMYTHLRNRLEAPSSWSGHASGFADCEPTPIDLEELLEYMDSADLLIFSDDEDLAAGREYVAAYLSSRPDPGRCTLALDAFTQSSLHRAHQACRNDRNDPKRFTQELARELGGRLPAGTRELLTVALQRRIPIIGLKQVVNEHGENALARLASLLHAEGCRGSVVALIGEEHLAPPRVEQALLSGDEREVRVVYQSPPVLFWEMRERHGVQELPQVLHLKSSWAFATLATHPVFSVSAKLANRDDDTLLPPLPAHSPRKPDTPMIELLLGAAELLRDSLYPPLDRPERVQVLTFLDPRLPERLEASGVPIARAEEILESVANGRSVADPDYNIAVIATPLLAPAVETIYRVMLNPKHGTRDRNEAIAGSTVAWALAFIGSCFIAGQSQWPDSDAFRDDPCSQLLLSSIENCIADNANPTSIDASNLDEHHRRECTRRVGRYLGARLWLRAEPGEIQLNETRAFLEANSHGRTHRETLIELARMALT